MTNQWISVKDRLPDKDQTLLVTYTDGDCAMLYWRHSINPLPQAITHWMPLPPPPPPPDPFMEWWKVNGERVSPFPAEDAARLIWMAAIASTKQP